MPWLTGMDGTWDKAFSKYYRLRSSYGIVDAVLHAYLSPHPISPKLLADAAVIRTPVRDARIS